MTSPNPPRLDPAQWLEAYGDYLYQYAFKRLRSAEAAEEVVQDTFFAALRSRDQYSGAGAERAWLLGILKRKVIDVFRARSRVKTVSVEEQNVDITELLFSQNGHWKVRGQGQVPTPDRASQNAELWAAFEACLEVLPRRQADVFAMREVDGLKSEEICKELDITPSNLWVLLHRARLSLANCLKSKDV